ncbi:MAG: putative metal-binding motif-containing protein [Archangium sp.]
MLLSLSGCVCGALDPTARFACSNTTECGPDFVCVRGECVSAALADAGPSGNDAGSTDGGASDGGGGDAGIDVDRDGYPVGVDCDDQAFDVHPGATELCSNMIDDDCDNLRDCEQLSCAGMQCGGGGTCMGGACMASTEVRCDDGVDNDGDTLIDCADSDCPAGSRCDDANSCSVMSACSADGGCVATQTVSCVTPPSTCYATNGSCQPDSGVCSYTQVTGRCNDGLICTDNETCTNGVCGGGTRRTCATSPNVCLGAGMCTEPAGTCVYAPLATGNCNDNNACTVTDRCDGDGGCVGTAITCVPPSQCHQNAGCIATSGCQFTARTGQPCDAGFPTAGTCSPGFVCNPPSAFPYTPSNFSPTMLPAGSPVALNLTCDATLNVTNNNPSFSAPCAAMPPQMVTIQGGPGVPDLVLVQTGTFTQTAGTTLTITGNKPVIFAVLGNATIAGKIRARNPVAASFCTLGIGADGQLLGDGSGGGGYGTNGGNGGLQNGGMPPPGGQMFGMPSITPLISGCRGGTSSSGGAGGGAVQFSVRDDLLVSGTITAPGLGGLTTMTFEPPGGGGSGGSILLEASNVSLAATSWLTANGGGGAKGPSLSGAGGVNGNDGAEASGMPALGGTGSGSGGNGGSGGASTLPALPGAPPTGGNSGAGAGGGAVGRIRLNAVGACTLSGGISPPATSNGASGCP